MDDLNSRLEAMIHQGTSQVTKSKLDEKSPEDEPKRPNISNRRPRRVRKTPPLEVQRYRNNVKTQYAIMTLPSGLLLTSFILIYLYPYTLVGVFAVFMCLFIGFKYFILWLNELSDEIMKMFK
eukprot:NODE_18_length_40692_cov_0.469183.p23 type:complete len:123 gc:universal NODE_18_length_40692_cov_0.469183:12568-12200(-)